MVNSLGRRVVGISLRTSLRFSCVLLALNTVAPTALAWTRNKPANVAAPAQAAQPKPDPELLLLALYNDLGNNNLREAQIKADALVAAYPTFQLGHLIRGDLLLAHARPVHTFGAIVSPGNAEKIKELREEAMARLRSYNARPHPKLIPRSIMQLRPDQKYALVVDAKRSRMYVYENTGQDLKLVTDYYITQGKLGIHKLREGDQKTPIGVYYITSRLQKSRLPDFYGAGALPINYPNEWDRINGRTGSGIWLHGTTYKNYSRPPLASDGCVVLTNPDLEKISSMVEVGNTPVIIADQVDFIDATQWQSNRAMALRLLDKWKQDFQSMDSNRLIGHYSRNFKSDNGEELTAWFARQTRSFIGITDLALSFRNVSFFLYPGKEDLIVGTFTQDTRIGKTSHAVRKRVYWQKEGAQWKIIYEGTLRDGSLTNNPKFPAKNETLLNTYRERGQADRSTG